MTDAATLDFTWDRAVPTTAARRNELLGMPGFGDTYSDHMVTARWHAERGWHDARRSS